MYWVGTAHSAHTHSWTVHRLATEFGLPGITVTRIAAALETAGLLVVSEDDVCTVARELKDIGVHEILSVARNQRSGHFLAREVPVAAVDAFTARLAAAVRATCGDETLQQEAAPLCPRDGHVGHQHRAGV